MIYKSLDLHDFIQAFEEAGRGHYYSYEGFSEIYEYLEQTGDVTNGCGYELDIIEICGMFTETDPESALRDYGMESLEEMEGNTYVTMLKNGNVLFMDF